MLSEYLFFAELIVWAIPPLKQFKGGYFLFFLVIAVSPFASVLGFYLIKLIPFTVYVIASFIMLVILQYYNSGKIKFLIITLIFPVSFIIYYNEWHYDLISIIILHTSIVIYVIYFLLQFLYKTNSLNLYYFVLVIYEASVVLKMITFLTNIQTGKLYFYITSIFELLIGIYFIFFNIENSPQFKLREK
jgi:hypothetical protein